MNSVHLCKYIYADNDTSLFFFDIILLLLLQISFSKGFSTMSRGKSTIKSSRAKEKSITSKDEANLLYQTKRILQCKLQALPQ